MLSGDLTSAQRRDLDRAIRSAETRTRLEFSAYIGPTESTPRDYAERLHAVLAVPDRSVLLMVDVHRQVFEVVTGSIARERISDDAAERIAKQFAATAAAGERFEALIGAIEALADASA